MTTIADIRARWAERRDEWRRLGVQVSGAAIADAFLADLVEVDAVGMERLNLTEAARECGFSADHLGRLVKAGTIENVGRPGAPRVRRCDLPRKATPTSRRDIAATLLARMTNHDHQRR